ncbi:hypothetical protein OY671_011742, partial [Metschnikowia pulcherrima]
LVATSAISAASLVALRPTHHDAGPNSVENESHATPENIVSAPKDYSQVPKLGPPLPGDLGGPILAAQQRGERVDLPPVGASTALPAANAADTLGQQARQEREAARTSSSFSRDGGIANAAAPSQPDPIPVMAGPGLETGANSAPG